jgi:Ankyrin repeats (3 copies)/Ankyrin repeats (many copies)
LDEFDLKSTDKHGNTILHSAFQSKNKRSYEVVQYLLDTQDLENDVQKKSKHDKFITIFSWPRLAFFRRCLTFFWQSRYFIFRAYHPLDERCLQAACMKSFNWLGIVRHLIEKTNVNINTLDNEGKTLLHLAARSGSFDTVVYLQRTGKIDINARDNGGQTVLHAAVQSAPFKLEVTFTSEDEDEDEELLSSNILKELPFNTVRFLVQNKVDVNAQDKKGFTALHLAVEKSDPVLMKYLVEQATIDPSILSKRGQTAYDLAKEIGMEHIVSFINCSIPRMKIETQIKTVPVSPLRSSLGFLNFKNVICTVIGFGIVYYVRYKR